MKRQEESQLIQMVHKPLSQRTEGDLNTNDNQEVVASPEAGQSSKEDDATIVVKKSHEEKL
jgi:hypothetical protein